MVLDILAMWQADLGALHAHYDQDERQGRKKAVSIFGDVAVDAHSNQDIRQGRKKAVSIFGDVAGRPWGTSCTV